MAEPDYSAGPSSFSSSAANRDSSEGASSSSAHASQPLQEETARDRFPHSHHHHHHHQYHFADPETATAYQGNITRFDDNSSVVRDDTWSCVIVLFTFWVFVSMTLILGVYGSSNLLLGSYSSILLQPNPIFVQYVKVENINSSTPGAMFYGFYESPPLDVLATWEISHRVTIPTDTHKEWLFYLNVGSQINISYSLSSPSSSIFLVIAEGREGLVQWLEDPTYPNTTLSWNLIHGSGMISQQIYKSSSYYVAVGNLNEEVKVDLNLNIRGIIYNTTGAYYKCSLSHGSCGLSILFPSGNAAVLTSPGLKQNVSSDELFVKVSYGPRWVTYIFGVGGMTILMYMAFSFLNKFHYDNEQRSYRTGVQYGQVAPERAPLLSHKDDDLSSWGSSYDSVSNDEKDLEDFLNSVEGKSVRDGETSNNTRRLCAICFDAPRDCFFLPCGHCAACFECGTRIVEAAGTCPVCRRNMRKVRKIFTV